MILTQPDRIVNPDLLGLRWGLRQARRSTQVTLAEAITFVF